LKKTKSYKENKIDQRFSTWGMSTPRSTGEAHEGYAKKSKEAHRGYAEF
jgi:hypothetical protein